MGRDNDKEKIYPESCLNDGSPKDRIVAFLMAQSKKLEQIKTVKTINYEKDQKRLFKSKSDENWKKEFHTADVLNDELTTLITVLNKEDFDYENFDLLKTINEIENKVVEDPACSLKKNNKDRFHKRHSKLMTYMMELKKAVNNIERPEELNETLNDIFLFTN